MLACACMLMTRYMTHIPLSSRYLIIVCDCCVRMDALPFSMLHLKDMQTSSAFFSRKEPAWRFKITWVRGSIVYVVYADIILSHSDSVFLFHDLSICIQRYNVYVYIQHIYVMCICYKCLHVHVCLWLDIWEYVCLTVDLTIDLTIIPSSSLHLLIFTDCCVRMGALPFIWLHLKVI